MPSQQTAQLNRIANSTVTSRSAVRLTNDLETPELSGTARMPVGPQDGACPLPERERLRQNHDPYGPQPNKSLLR